MDNDTHAEDRKTPHESKVAPSGHSMLFLIVTATFILLVSSSIIYSVTIKSAIEQQSTEMALSGLLTVLEMTYPAVKAIASSDPETSSVLGSFSESFQYYNDTRLCLPFLMQADEMTFTEGSGIPSLLANEITSRYLSGAFVAHPVPPIPDPSRICKVTLNDHTWLTVAVPLRDTDKMLGLTEDITPYIIRAKKVEQILVGFLVLGYVFFLMLLILVLRIITDPLKILTVAAGRFARGDFDIRVAVPKTVSEVQILSEAFNEMGSKLKAQRDSLEAYSHELEQADQNRGLALDELNRRSRELERINHISRTISGELDIKHLLKDVVQFTQQTTSADCAFIGLIENGQFTIRQIIPADIEIKMDEMSIQQNTLLAELIYIGAPILDSTSDSDNHIQGNPFAQRNGFNSFIGIPITHKGIVMGVICCFSSEYDAFTSSDSYSLGLLASQVAIGLENARLFEEIMTRDRRRDSQLMVAQKLQSNRMPKNFKQNIAGLACKLRPADELAGDFCDVFTLGRNSVAIVIGDVANKGVAASLMTFSLLSMFRNIAKTHKSPCELLKSINKSLISQIKEEGWFATAFYAKFNTKTCALTYSSAGHEMPIWHHADTGKIEMLEIAGYPLGLFSDFDFETREIEMKIGDRLVLYTDGVTDAVDPKGVRLGHKALMDMVSSNAHLSSDDLIEKIMVNVEDFMGGMKQRDDIIVAVLELQNDPWIRKSIVFKESADLISEIMQALAPYGLSSQEFYGIRLAVDEAVANAWRHGSNQRDDVEFQVSYLIDDKGFQFRVKDSGMGFDHESLPDPTVEENLFKSHGRGVFLIKQVMGEVEFNETGNEITIVKLFQPGGETEDLMYETNSFDSIPALRQQQDSLNSARNASNAKVAGNDCHPEEPSPS
jgi:phosphoserine phosphatase RsbU/P